MKNNRLKYKLIRMITGSLIGFVLFLFFLESKGMGNIILRNGKFVPWNVIQYMKNPFIRSHLWYPQMWRANWLIMIISGAGVEYMIDFIKRMIKSQIL